MNGNVKVPSEKYVVTENTDGTVTVTPTKDSKYYTGSKTITVSGAENQKPGTPMISSVKVTGNKATVILSDEAEGASGYDYVIPHPKILLIKMHVLMLLRIRFRQQLTSNMLHRELTMHTAMHGHAMRMVRKYLANGLTATHSL